MTTRRRFIKSTLAGSVALTAFKSSLFAHDDNHLAASDTVITNTANFIAPMFTPRAGEIAVTILHTNDTHSQIDPLPANDARAGMGGVARRATLVNQVRKANPNVLLCDAGDAFQGTPYFNLYKGEVEFKAMSAIGYDAMTLGNHEFDNGVDSLVTALAFADFPIVNANYEIKNTKLEPIVKPYIVKQIGNTRIGIFGLGVKLEGLNAPATFRGVVYRDPIAIARDTIKTLREIERCTMIVCLSHLGYYPDSTTQTGDTQVAAQVNGIDFTVGGHSHTFMDAPAIVKQPDGKPTVIFQVGKSGIYLGRVDFLLRDEKIAEVKGCLLNTRV